MPSRKISPSVLFGNHSFLGTTKRKYWTIFLSVSLCFVSIPSTSATQIVRSSIDRIDDVTGFQIHFVYVVPSGSADLNADTNGQIESWAKEGNLWLKSKVGRSLIIDTFQGAIDVTFLQSKYRVSEMCIEKCETLSKLKDEYIAQNLAFDNSKTLFFVIADKLDKNSCGWADYASNLALSHSSGDTNGGCNWPTSKARTGLNGPAKTIVHELIHTFGVHHVCMDESDLMIGSPECVIDRGTLGNVAWTLDSKANQYMGSEDAFGIDVLKLPIWSDGLGSKSYAEIKQISNDKYLPQLTDGEIYAVVGERSRSFAWDWDRNSYPSGAGIKCQFRSGSVLIMGDVEKSSCTFDVPNTLRAGKKFTVSQSWVRGPWYGEAMVTGTLVRKDLSSDICSVNTCIVGGITLAEYSCWPSDVKTLVLQQIIGGKWIDVKNVQMSSGTRCNRGTKYVNYPETTLKFEQSGIYIYRWKSPAQSGFSQTLDTPFAVVVNDENSPEPTQVEINSANAQAQKLGEAADLVKSAKPATRKTIICVKGKQIKTVSGVKPVCPTGYKKK